MQKQILCAGAMLLSLTACAEHEKIKFVCPQVAIIHDLEKTSDYGLETGHNEKDLVATATMKNIEGACTFEEGDKDKKIDPERGISVNFTLKASALKGPRMGADQFGFPYFVALVDPSQKILAKNMMTLNVKFNEVNKTVDIEEPLHVFIPLPTDADARDYRVLTGFQLTEQQLKDLRAAK